MACGRRCGQGARFNACVRIEPYVHPVDDEAEGAAAAASAVAPPPLPLALVVGVVEVVGLVGIRDPEACTEGLLRRGIELPAAGGFTPLATESQRLTIRPSFRFTFLDILKWISK
jgi:hypothetical protein